VLRVEYEVVALGAEVDSRLLAQEDKGKDVTILYNCSVTFISSRE
jgi:hypothetical protein